MDRRQRPDHQSRKMFQKVIQIAVISWCLSLPFTAARLPTVGEFRATEYVHKLRNRISYRLPNDTKPETYNISLRTGISEGKFDYDGFISISILVVSTTREVTIHSRRSNIKSIRLTNANGSPIELLPLRTNAVTDFLIIPTKSVELLPGSRYRLDVKFGGVLGVYAYGFFRTLSDFAEDPADRKWVAVTSFEPSHARSAFPCYDEPRLKANVTIQITHGANYTADSNMPGTRSENPDGTVTTRFATTPLMSTYLVAFSVTNFRYRSNAANSSLPMRVLAAPSRLNETRFLLNEGEKAVKALEMYLEVPYALPKFDQILISRRPIVGIGRSGMENWGLTAYEHSFPINENTTSSRDQMTCLALIAHEVSHQWFGNVITPKWWSGIWLKEGFASFFQNIVIELVYPEYNIFDRFVVSTLRNAFYFDEYPITRPMTRYVETPSEVKSMFNTISYVKGACITRMLLHVLTEASFKKGIKNFLLINSFSAVDEDDLFSELDRAAKEDGTLSPNLNVNDIFSSWTRQAGFPLLTVNRNYVNGSITISQERYLRINHSNLINATTWWIPYNIATANSSSFNQTTPGGWLPQNQRTQLIEPSGNNSWGPTDWVLFNKQQTGYYRVMYDIRNWKLLIAELNTGNHSRIPPINRSQLINDMMNLVQSGRLPADMLVEMVKYLKHETEYAPWVTGSEALLYLNQNLASTKDHESFRRSAVSIIQSAEKHLALKALQNDSHSTKETRAILTELAEKLLSSTISYKQLRIYIKS